VAAWLDSWDTCHTHAQVVGTPTREEIEAMNPNYTEFKFPQIKPHSWARVFKAKATPEAIDLISKLLQYTPGAPWLLARLHRCPPRVARAAMQALLVAANCKTAGKCGSTLRLDVGEWYRARVWLEAETLVPAFSCNTSAATLASRAVARCRQGHSLAPAHTRFCYIVDRQAHHAHAVVRTHTL